MSSAIELAGPAAGPLDEPPSLRLRGAGPEADVVWRARLRDDDERVWRAQAPRAAALDDAWQPAKTPAAPHAALASLRPVRVEVRAELADGRAATRTITRQLLGDGVRVRRWRGAVAGSLVLPAAPPVATLLVDATADAAHAPPALLAAALLATRGVLVLLVPAPAKRTPAELVAEAAERLRAVPGAGPPLIRPAAEIPLPPGVPATVGEPAARAAGWDALLAGLGAVARATPPSAPEADTSRL